MEKDRYVREDNASRERWDVGAYSDELEQNEKHHSKDKKKSSREEEKDHRSRDRERDRSKRSNNEVLKGRENESSEKDRVSARERRKDDRDEHGKDRSKDSKGREKKEIMTGISIEIKNMSVRERRIEKIEERIGRGIESLRRRGDRIKVEIGTEKRKETRQRKGRRIERELRIERRRGKAASSEIEERIVRMKEERLKKKSEGISEISAWVSKNRKIEEKMNAEKEKALQLSKNFEEQDNFVQGEDEDEEANNHPTRQMVYLWPGIQIAVAVAFRRARYHYIVGIAGAIAVIADDLAGMKVLHGLDKVMDGGAVVLTLKDQSILANGDINEDIDMLENTEIGEQKRRDEAYKAAKKKTGVYDDKFHDEPGSEKKILPQYDDPITDEGAFTGEAEKKLEELRKRLQGVTPNNRVEDLNNAAKISSDYYTQEEMLRFKKLKKKKALRKKEKLDINALEAEAISSGLGAGDLGSRNDSRRLAIKEEEARSEAEKRNSAYQAAYAKADEASKLLRLETLTLALKKQEEKSGPQAIALLATKAASNQTADDQNTSTGEAQDYKVVITEMEEFVWGLQLDEEAHKPDSEDVFMEEDEVPGASEQDQKNAENEKGGWSEVADTSADEKPANEDEIVPDETIHEVAVGKGLSDEDRQNDRFKDIRIERTDEFGRIMTPKEAFRNLSHKFHGKGPGKIKQEKRMKQYQEELKLKQMKNSDTPSLSVERMRDAQAQLKTPYLVLSGHVKPGQTSDPASGFATVEKDFPGSLTPMIGDRKASYFLPCVEHFLGIKRKAEHGNSGAPKKPKT
ncbi:U4/U6.U5 tri-snRNP-associated protein 1 isoform 3 [Hibiscus syriacus]|uniref:U4/U6.U5 tri-snRNP-associated protein 1 isoform 3 n=1 Tax=Hibiscus syriacus TaxID=106335 RepID=A0A6A2ZK16_HIBSY|nr:U4/U6.U5 tri-snRNP-associated protein 1 isoform 3 [Hibiscus syriacus]